MRSRSARLAATMGLLVGLTATSASLATTPSARWVTATPDGIVALAATEAARGGDDALARVALLASLAPEAAAGTVREALAGLGRGRGPVAEEARWLARALAPEPAAQASDASVDGPTEEGLVRTFSIFGPLGDTGGGLARREGLELPRYDPRTADASWGAVTVRPRRTEVASVTARGVPLDRYLHPRRESCSYLATAITVAVAEPVVVHLASSGSYRLLWDGRDVAASGEVHRRALFDRAAVTVEASAGEHVIAVKVCSGAQSDEGRMRLRLARPDGRALDLPTSSAPEALAAALEAARRAPAPSFRLARTALDAATELEREPTTDQSLRAAAVRILGGADDLQSPRAPGMLGLVAATAGIDAQTLALAGYLAPSGANRSGWLRRAHEKSLVERDADARAFTQRALVLAQLGSMQQDLALATLEAAPLGEAHDAQAELIRAEAYARLGNHGLRLKAVALLEAAAARAGDAAPEALLRALAQFTQGSRPSVHLEAMRRLVAVAPGYRGPDHVLAHQLLDGEALDAAAWRDLAHVGDGRALERLGKSLLERGRHATALAVFRRAAALSPNRVDAHLGVARALEALGGHDAAGIRAALARARELEPGDAGVAAELAFREGERAGVVDLGPDAAFLVPASEFLARAKERPAPREGVFERQLHWRRIVRMHPDQRISQTMHYAREIVVEPRTEDQRYEQVPEASASSELLVARVHRPDGTVLEPEERDSTGSQLRWPPLRRGDVVEIAVRSFTPGPVGRRGDAPFYFVDYVGAVSTEPVLYNEVVLDAPIGAPLAYDVIGGKADRTLESTVGGRRITQLIWDAPPVIADEPLAPPASETLPVVVGSIYPTWKDFLGWYRGAIEGFTEPDEQIKQVARELTAGKTTREEKLAALFDFVADGIRYVNYTSGEWWLPNRPQHLLARRQGDCDDKANLLISLLRATGIDATEVLIQTRYTAQPRILFESKIAIPMFDHGIVFLPEAGGGGRFLDATSPQTRLGAPPAMDARAAAVLVADDAVRPIPTPPSSPDEHGVDATWTVELEPDGSARVHAKERHVGDSAFLLRTNLGQEDTRAQWVESHLVARSLPSARLEGEVGFEGELPGGAARLEYQASSRSLGRREGDDLVVQIAPPIPFAMQLAPLPSRTLPVQLPPQLAPSHHEVTIDLVVPKGLRLAALPPNDELPGAAFGAARQTIEANRDMSRVRLRRSLRFDASRIEVADYARWRAWLRDVDRMMRRPLRLVPAPKK